MPDSVEPAEFRAPESRDDWNDYIKKLIPRPKAMDGSDHDFSELPFHRWLPGSDPEDTNCSDRKRRLRRWMVELGHSCITALFLR